MIISKESFDAVTQPTTLWLVESIWILLGVVLLAVGGLLILRAKYWIELKPKKVENGENLKGTESGAAINE